MLYKFTRYILVDMSSLPPFMSILVPSLTACTLYVPVEMGKSWTME